MATWTLIIIISSYYISGYGGFPSLEACDLAAKQWEREHRQWSSQSTPALRCVPVYPKESHQFRW
jgi:hypothetical protein